VVGVVVDCERFWKMNFSKLCGISLSVELSQSIASVIFAANILRQQQARDDKVFFLHIISFVVGLRYSCGVPRNYR
jgi:hypothetical protein